MVSTTGHFHFENAYSIGLSASIDFSLCSSRSTSMTSSAAVLTHRSTVRSIVRVRTRDCLLRPSVSRAQRSAAAPSQRNDFTRVVATRCVRCRLYGVVVFVVRLVGVCVCMCRLACDDDRLVDRRPLGWSTAPSRAERSASHGPSECRMPSSTTSTRSRSGWDRIDESTRVESSRMPSRFHAEGDVTRHMRDHAAHPAA
jgi:hypothetical protein